MLVVDDISYNIPVISLRRKANFLDKYAERTEDGVLHRELIGVYFNYQLKLGGTLDRGEYRRLWRKLTEAKAFHTVTVPDETGEFTFTAYFTNVGDELRHQYGEGSDFRGLTVNFIARSPARR